MRSRRTVGTDSMRARGVAALVVVLAAAALAPAVQGPPLPPYELFGHASNETGTPLPVGTVLRAFIDGVEYSNASTVVAPDGSYAMSVAGNSFTGGVSDTPTVKEGGDPGDPVVLVNGDFVTTAVVFREAGTWQAGSAVPLDLRAAVGSKQSGLLKIQSVIVRPADGSTQYAFVCNPSSGSDLDLSRYYLQKDVPGSANGPTVVLSGLVAPGATSYIDLGPSTFLVPAGDGLKLVWRNPGGADAPAGSSDIVVDRLEFNATSGGTLTWEPGNTIMTDASAPGLGQEIRRSPQCFDTNSGADFQVAAESGRRLPPGVNLQTPDGGEDWTGGFVHDIRYTISDANDASLTVAIALSTDRGFTFPTTIFGPSSLLVGTKSFSWTVNLLDSASARVRVCATNLRPLTNCDSSGADFAIDSTAPTVLALQPSPGATDVRLNEPIRVRFSESMNRSSSQGAVSVSSTMGPFGPLTFSWVTTIVPNDTLLVDHPDFDTDRLYTVTFAPGAKDASDPGNLLAFGAGVSFKTSTNRPPQVTVTGPTGCVSGGFDQVVTWTMSDPEMAQLVVYANYTSSAGGGPIVGPVIGATSATWRVPAGLNADDLRVVVTVFDPQGANRTAAGAPLRADSTPPTVVSTIPVAGAAGVARTEPMAITFSEPMDKSATEAAVDLAPLDGALSFSWSNTTLVIQHTPLRFNTTYALTIGVGARDACAPGTPLAIPFTLDFSTEANNPPLVVLDEPTGVASLAPGSAVRVAWTMSDDRTPASQLVVFVNYSSSSGSGTIVQGTGITNTSWKVPSLDASDVRIEVVVVDQGGLRGAANGGPFAVHPAAAAPTDFALIAEIAIAAVAVVVFVIVVLGPRRRKPPDQTPPPQPPPSAPPPEAP